MKRHHSIGAALSTLLLALASGCGGSGGGSNPPGGDQRADLIDTPAGKLTLTTVSSCDAFESFVARSVAELMIRGVTVPCPNCVIANGSAVGILASAEDSSSFRAFTTTNTQELGVDELDYIDTDIDGNFYVVDEGRLIVANGLPPDELSEIASLELTANGFAEGLILDPANDRIVAVVSDFSFFVQPAALTIAPPVDPIAQLVLIDVADPANPVIDGRVLVSGFRLAVRRIGSRIHVVTHATPAIPDEIFFDNGLQLLRDELQDAISAEDDALIDALQADIHDAVASLVAASGVEAFLPDVTIERDGMSVDASRPNCADVALPDVDMPLAVTSVTSIDSDGTNPSTLMVANNAWNVYTSEASVYLTQSSGGWWFDDRQKQQTAIYKVSIGSGAPQYRALGVVDGWLGSSFQLSEHDGFLRAVTHRTDFDPDGLLVNDDNGLYVLEDDGVGTLRIVGDVVGFGAREQIFATRLLGDRGFVVTFRQIDPLFAFDLSDPRDPRLLGELEIPGVSTYIHPLDDAHLLTIGYDGDDQRLNGDFQLQIFDVQNLDDPRLIHKLVPEFDAAGHTWTSATHDHRAFNYFAEAGTLTVPVQYRAAELHEDFSGFVAFRVDTQTGFSELGRLDHSDLARARDCVTGTGSAPLWCTDGTYLESARPLRSVSALVGDATWIYTLSTVGMKSSTADDFANPAGSMTFAGSQ